jgi:hypothetical protein
MNTGAKLRRAGIAGVVLGVLACLLCALPVLLAFVGLAGVNGVIASIPLDRVESVGLALAFTGSVLLMFVGIRRSKA